MPEDKIIILNPPENNETGGENTPGGPQLPPPKLTRAQQSRINGAKSRGPKTPRGKGASCMNAFKHGLRMKNPIPILIEDSAYYPHFLDAYLERLKPCDPLEHQLVSEIASIDWRLTRFLAFESRMIDTQFRLEHAQGSPEEFPLSKAVAGYRKLVDSSALPEHLSKYTESLARTRRTLYDTLDRLRQRHPRHARTQMPNIHNHLDPEDDPQSNPVGLRTNPPSGSPEPEETAA